MNIPKLKAFCKHGQKMHKCSTGADYLNGSHFPISVPKWKKQGLFLLGVRPSCLQISPLLTLDSLEIGVQEIAERAIAFVVVGGALACQVRKWAAKPE